MENPRFRGFLIKPDGSIVGGSGERATDEQLTATDQRIGAYAVLSPDGTPIIAIAYPPETIDFSIYD